MERLKIRLDGNEPIGQAAETTKMKRQKPLDGTLLKSVPSWVAVLANEHEEASSRFPNADTCFQVRGEG